MQDSISNHFENEIKYIGLIANKIKISVKVLFRLLAGLGLENTF